MFIRKGILTLLLCSVIIQVSIAQKRLELLETNINTSNISEYTESYLWTKNWWLVSSMLIDTSKRGNTIAENSTLSKDKIDSLSKEFRKCLSPEIIRFGNLVPRINFIPNKKIKPYIRSFVYETTDQTTKLIGSFLIEFGSKKHNSMFDIYNIHIEDP